MKASAVAEFASGALLTTGLLSASLGLAHDYGRSTLMGPAVPVDRGSEFVLVRDTTSVGYYAVALGGFTFGALSLMAVAECKERERVAELLSAFDARQLSSQPTPPLPSIPEDQNPALP